MARYASFRELIVWQKGMDLAVLVYRLTQQLPVTDRYGLASQLRRASTSIPANVAEGFCRQSRSRYRYHVAVALGSQAEVQTHVELVRRLALGPPDLIESIDRLCGEVGRLLNGLWRALGPVAVCYSLVLPLLPVGVWVSMRRFLTS